MPESNDQKTVQAEEEVLAQTRRQAAAAEIVSQTLLAIVAEMVACVESPYRTTQKRWAALVLTLLANNPNVQIDGNLRSRLEQLRDGR